MPEAPVSAIDSGAAQTVLEAAEEKLMKKLLQQSTKILQKKWKKRFLQRHWRTQR